MDIRARIVPVGSLFGVKIIAISDVGGRRERTEKLEDERFFNKQDARAYARNRHGIRDEHIWDSPDR